MKTNRFPTNQASLRDDACRPDEAHFTRLLSDVRKYSDMKILCTLLLAYVLSSSSVNAQRKYDSSHTETAEYSNSVRVVGIINLQTNFTAAIEISKQKLYDGKSEPSLWNYAQKKYADILCIYLSNDELLEIINTYPNLTNEKCIKCISFVQNEAYRQGELAQVLLNNPSFVEASKKASNPDLSHEECIRILDEIPIDVKEDITGPNNGSEPTHAPLRGSLETHP